MTIWVQYSSSGAALYQNTIQHCKKCMVEASKVLTISPVFGGCFYEPKLSKSLNQIMVLPIFKLDRLNHIILELTIWLMEFAGSATHCWESLKWPHIINSINSFSVKKRKRSTFAFLAGKTAKISSSTDTLCYLNTSWKEKCLLTVFDHIRLLLKIMFPPFYVLLSSYLFIFTINFHLTFDF